MKIKLSVICPIYKVESHIVDFVESLIRGVNDPEVEVIFINDCSPDKSIDLCESVLNENNNFIRFSYKIVNRKKNGGLSLARNTGLSIAQGEYVSFVDSDDAISSYYWKFLEKKLDSKVDIVEFNYKEFFTLPLLDEPPLQKEIIPVSQLNPYKTGFFAWKRVFKRSLLKGMRFPVGWLYEDMYFVNEAYSKTRNIKHYSAVLVFYRQRVGSITNYRTDKFYHQLVNLIKSTQVNLDGFYEKPLLVKCLVKKTLIILLKGLRIPDRELRKKFFSSSEPWVAEVCGLQRRYGCTLMGKVWSSINMLLCKLAYKFS